MRLCQTASGEHIWGDFNIDIEEGHLRSSTITTPLDGPIRFQWRGRDTGTDEIEPGPENVIHMQFTDEESFTGDMFLCAVGDSFDISGKIDWEQTKGCDFTGEVDEWKAEYRALSMSQWEADNGMGPGRGRGCADSPEGSDSSACDEDDEESDIEEGEEEDEDEGGQQGELNETWSGLPYYVQKVPAV
ncbi:hypothetical protein BT63DRAFT_426601 [Microthyrium microscopicum]|uniref:Uncharacterized protein n=1 Tax=Microthyrium microscopicum TaxID=703497 RepID=A0A6A6U8X6_9PEZI|nr:hypothetical protein BT63DRAFT_426601 [Microthyrium microscopicum]